jgi:hypothetical protein
MKIINTIIYEVIDHNNKVVKLLAYNIFKGYSRKKIMSGLDKLQGETLKKLYNNKGKRGYRIRRIK